MTIDESRRPTEPVGGSETRHLITIGAGNSTWTGTYAEPLFRQAHHDAWVPHLDRLFMTLTDRNLDGLVVQLRPNVYYLSGYSSRTIVSRHETDSQAAVIIARDEPNHPVLVLTALDADRMVSIPTWVRDIRPFIPHIVSPDIPLDAQAFDRFVSRAARETEWGARARSNLRDGFRPTCEAAMAELGLTKGRVGFDNLSFAKSVAHPDVEIFDAYNTMRFIRQVKTPQEIQRLSDAAALNEIAIANTIRSWTRGMTWSELGHIYDLNCIALGGFVQQDGGMVIANDETEEPIFHSVSGPEDFEIEPGTSMLLDCHGSLDLYRWDGGKTWVVDESRSGDLALIQRACTEASMLLTDELLPGASIHDLQRRGLDVFRKLGVPDYDRALVFFHGLGLDHTDIEVRGTGSRPDWNLEQDMVVATHVAYPGNPRERFYLEDVATVTHGGGKSLYTWGWEPHH